MELGGNGSRSSKKKKGVGGEKTVEIVKRRERERERGSSVLSL